MWISLVEIASCEDVVVSQAYGTLSLKPHRHKSPSQALMTPDPCRFKADMLRLVIHLIVFINKKSEDWFYISVQRCDVTSSSWNGPLSLSLLL